MSGQIWVSACVAADRRSSCGRATELWQWRNEHGTSSPRRREAEPSQAGVAAVAGGRRNRPLCSAVQTQWPPPCYWFFYVSPCLACNSLSRYSHTISTNSSRWCSGVGAACDATGPRFETWDLVFICACHITFCTTS